MRIKNTSILSINFIINALRRYSDHFKIDIDYNMDEIFNEQGYPFVDASDGILICDPHNYDVVCSYGGLTYIHGATSVYTYQQERISWDGRFWYLFENRILHEILHHFNKDSHGLYEWLKKNHPLLFILYRIAGCNGETFIGSRCERMFYEYLLQDVYEDSFNRDNDIEKRNYKGVLKDE